MVDRIDFQEIAAHRRRVARDINDAIDAEVFAPVIPQQCLHIVTNGISADQQV